MAKNDELDKDSLKDIAWKGARTVDGHDVNLERMDACGAWIHYDDFENHNSEFGWEIDHVFPITKLRSLKIPRKLWNHATNIRAMHWLNNQSKANSYPTYISKVQAKNSNNVESVKTFYVEEALQYSLRCIFKIKSLGD
jgi:hypothetical protein